MKRIKIKVSSQKFPCDQCGICCMHIDRVECLKELDRGDGQCKYLINHLCSIYEKRPDICNVDKMYELFFQNKMTREAYCISKKSVLF